MDDLRESLKQVGALPDAKVPLAETALLLSGLVHTGRDLDRYRHHIAKLSHDVGIRYAALIEAGAERTSQTQLAALKHILSDQCGYEGDVDRYDDLSNADLISVIERRKGLPVALCLLSIEAGRAQGWDVQGLNFPGHFILRLEKDGSRILCDPFHQFRILQAQDLRALLKQVAGVHAELGARHYEPASNREILLRLQNNIKLRLIEQEAYEEALQAVETMRLFAPEDIRLWLDSAVLCARTGRLQTAISVLEDYIKAVPDPRDRADAQLLLRNLQDRDF
jgi:regulator of sirC expression with transglutaminase-like and TPR domain